MGHRILIVGCGQLGSRHLQAVAPLPEVVEVEIVDPRPESLSLGRDRVSEVLGCGASTKFRWLSSLEEASQGGDLCIVATLAKGRCQLVRDVANTLGYSSFLLEKIVGQSTAEIESLLEFSKARALSVWVNCQTRAFPFHERVKRRLDPQEPIVLSVVGGNHGLATNGVHHADLFAFYDQATSIKSSGSSVDPVLHPSKRGDSLFDLSGALNGHSDKGSRFNLVYAADHISSEQVYIATRQYRCIVDQVYRWAIESDSNTGWAWQPAPFEGNIFVSHMTKQFASDIFAHGRCALPDLEESLVSHRFILSELQPHFSRLLSQDVELCPVT